MTIGNHREIQPGLAPNSGSGLLEIEINALEGPAARSKLIARIRAVMDQACFSQESAANLLGLSSQDLGILFRAELCPRSAQELFCFVEILSRAARWGRFEGHSDTAWLKLHNVLSEKPKPLEEIAEEAKLQESGGDELDKLVEAGVVIKVNENGTIKYAISPLQLQVEKLRAENRFLKHNLALLLFKTDENIDLDLDSLLQQSSNEPSLEQLIEELEKEGD